MRIAIDIDMVCANTIQGLKSRVGKCNIVSRRWVDSMDIEQRELSLSLLQDPEFMLSLKPIEFSSLGTQSLLDVGAELYYITARHKHLAEITVEWLDKYNFAPGEVYLEDSKLETDQKLKIKTCIEDSGDWALTLAKKRIKVYLLDYAYNADIHHSYIHRVNNWQAILKMIEDNKFGRDK